MQQFDFLLVGQGLAGSSLYSCLEAAGHRVAMVDEPVPAAASPVASGMWNPLTFRLLLKSWRVDELLPAALAFYAQEAAQLQLPLLQSLEILRIFPDEAARHRWDERLADAAYQAYLSTNKLPASQSTALDLKTDHGLVQGAGWLNLPMYLQGIRQKMKQAGTLFEMPFRAEDLHWESEGAQWMQLKVRKIIVCRGQAERHHPWFNWLPLKPAQGDVLTLRIPNLRLEQIYNAGFFILPLGNDLYRVGATYEWDQLSEVPTDAGKTELLQKFESAYTGAYQLIDHQAGIRPTVADRRPLLGQHPEHQQICIFNGLGTKGVMIAPYFAQQMSNWLQGSGEIEDEVNIKRFRKRYEQQSGKRWME
jgi:glycine oxidase